jgi:hypothetical protein
MLKVKKESGELKEKEQIWGEIICLFTVYAAN